MSRRNGLAWKAQSRAGQALLEMAVYGGVCMMALGFLIRVGMMMNYQQEIRMAAYRRALAACRSDDPQMLGQMGLFQDAVATNYYMQADRQDPNPTDVYMGLPRSRTGAGGFLACGERLSFAYELNGRKSAGERTHERVHIRSNNTEMMLTDNDWAGGGGVSGNEGIVAEVTLANSTSGSVTQTVSGGTMTSGMGSSTGTTNDTQLVVGGAIGTNLGSSAGAGWSGQ